MNGQQVGLQLKEKALDRFEGSDWLVRARIAARFYLTRGLGAEITIDTVYELVGPAPSANTAGAVFRPADFIWCGYTTSCKPEGHGNKIGKWRLR